MKFLFSLLAGNWHWLAIPGGILAALLASYAGGKKIGKAEQQVKSAKDQAEKTAAQAVVVNQQQQREEARGVEINNSNLDAAAARHKLQQSKYHQP